MGDADSAANRLRLTLVDGAQQLGIALTDKHVESLIAFLDLLYKWNRVYNLTAVRSIDDMVSRHILDSLSLLHYLPPAANHTSDDKAELQNYDVMDVGTGAGLPVLPLAIVRPDLTFLSVESNGKKTRFQHQVLVALNLRNVLIQQDRIEDVHDHSKIVISRGFTAPDKFLQAVQKNCSADSRVIVMLGTKERMPNPLPAGYIIHDIQEIDIPQCEATRHIAVCLYTPSSKCIERI